MFVPFFLYICTIQVFLVMSEKAKETPKYKKHHAKLHDLPSKKYKFNKDEEDDINDTYLNGKLCGYCHYFGTSDCPYLDSVEEYDENHGYCHKFN